MKKKRLVKYLKVFGILFPLSFLMTFSTLLYGSSSMDNTASSMALAFDKYYKETGQDFIAAEFSSSDPRNPIRDGSFTNVSAYQNFWQLKKGPDNSLIRIITPAYLNQANRVVVPLTLYPKEDPSDDSGAIIPLVYTGYDKDFRGDYLDLKIVQLKDKTKQIQWSDFYSGGKMENYKTDRHSILISQKTARLIYSNRFNVPESEVTDDNIESLVGTILRCKNLDQNGVYPQSPQTESEATEYELKRPVEDQDQDIINSIYFNEQKNRLKKIIGIIDDKSAEKYMPIFKSHENGDPDHDTYITAENFIFVVPNETISYDYFHPTAYGMFKKNLVGNRTSLLYFLMFRNFELSHKDSFGKKDYFLYFCDINDGVLNKNGTLQANYLKCNEFFYQSNTHVIIGDIMLTVSILLMVAIGAIMFFYSRKNKDDVRQHSLLYLCLLLFSLLISVFVFYLFKRFIFMSFMLPTLSIDGFGTLLLFNVLLILAALLMTNKRKERVEETEPKNSLPLSTIVTRKDKILDFVMHCLFGALIGFASFIIVNVYISGSSTGSIGRPAIVFLIGTLIGVCAYKKKKMDISKPINKQIALKELLRDFYAAIGAALGILIAFALGALGLIWVNGIFSSSSIIKMIISAPISVILFSSLYWITYFGCKLIRRIKIFIKNSSFVVEKRTNLKIEEGDNDDTISI